MLKPKILVFDLEFRGSQNYKQQLKIDPGYIICFSCKELGKAKVTTYSALTHPGKDITDDRRLVKAALEHLRGADMYVFHYGAKVDAPFIQTRALKYGFPLLPEPLTMVDTCRVAQQKLSLKSNSLAALAKFFQLPEQKMPVTEEQWYMAFAGDKQTLRLVEKRCASDVRLTEQVYKKLRPVMDKHPAIRLLYGGHGKCQACGHRLVKNGYRATAAGLSHRYRCHKCGACTSKVLTRMERDALYTK